MRNILDKTDKSTRLVFGSHGKKSKREVFDWTTGGSPGVYREISKRELNIDGEYQREAVSEKKVKKIASTWDWLLLGVICVVKREDGALAVFDGGHRVRASYYREDVDLLPCIVHEMSDLGAEAKAFFARNTMVNGVSAYDRHRAAKRAGEPLAAKSQEILDGLDINLCHSGDFRANGTKQRNIRCIGTIRKAVAEDEVLASECLIMCADIADGNIISSKLVSGLFRLCRHQSPERNVLLEFGVKLQQHSQGEILIAIRQYQAECGLGGENTNAKAIMKLINKGLRTKQLKW